MCVKRYWVFCFKAVVTVWPLRKLLSRCWGLPFKAPSSLHDRVRRERGQPVQWGVPGPLSTERLELSARRGEQSLLFYCLPDAPNTIFLPNSVWEANIFRNTFWTWRNKSQMYTDFSPASFVRYIMQLPGNQTLMCCGLKRKQTSIALFRHFVCVCVCAIQSSRQNIQDKNSHPPYQVVDFKLERRNI